TSFSSNFGGAVSVSRQQLDGRAFILALSSEVVAAFAATRRYCGAVDNKHRLTTSKAAAAAKLRVAGAAAASKAVAAAPCEQAGAKKSLAALCFSVTAAAACCKRQISARNLFKSRTEICSNSFSDNLKPFTVPISLESQSSSESDAVLFGGRMQPSCLLILL
uniref:Uncharacterized protein n=1 Tax=Romanomermis culicivorax TaxID=13658 RepID=A0A915KJY4_ROMCU